MHRKFPGTIEVDGDYLIVNGRKIRIYAEKDPLNLPWKDLGIDVLWNQRGIS